MLAVMLCLWMLAGFQWTWSLYGIEPDPILPTALAAAFTAFVGIRAWSAWRSLSEVSSAVTDVDDLADLFSRLRGLGYRVLQQLPADGGNIDYVVISDRGLFAITTVFRSLPLRGPKRAFFDGRAVSIANNPADESPVVLAKSRAMQLRRLILETADHDYPVRPVLLFPGWQVESVESDSFAELWALAPRELPMWFGNQPQTVHGRDVKHIADALTEYQRQFR